jgi:hypothetical protein
MHGSDAMLSAARRGFRDRFLRLVDPEGLLNPVEREVRADRLLRAHMLALAAKSAQARHRSRHAEQSPASPPAVSISGSKAVARIRVAAVPLADEALRSGDRVTAEPEHDACSLPSLKGTMERQSSPPPGRGPR